MACQVGGTGFMGKIKLDGVDTLSSGWSDHNDYRCG